MGVSPTVKAEAEARAARFNPAEYLFVRYNRQLWECKACGSIVRDPEWHVTWHTDPARSMEWISLSDQGGKRTRRFKVIPRPSFHGYEINEICNG